MRNPQIALIAVTLLIGGCSKVPSAESAAREVDTICQQIYQKHFTDNGQPMLKVESKTDGGGKCHALVDVEETRAGPQKEMRTYEVDFTYEEFGDRFTWEGLHPTIVARGPMPTLDSEEALLSYADYALKPRNNCAGAIQSIVEGKTPIWDETGTVNGCATISYRIWNKLMELQKTWTVAQEPSGKVCLDYANRIDVSRDIRTPIIMIDESPVGKCVVIVYRPDSNLISPQLVNIEKETLDYTTIRGGGVLFENKQYKTLSFHLTDALDGSLTADSEATAADLTQSLALREVFAKAAVTNIAEIRSAAERAAQYAAEQSMY